MSDTILTTEDTEITKTAKSMNELTERLIGCAIEVQRALGPGLLESTYEMCLSRELNLQEIPFLRQQPIPVLYKGVKLDCGLGCRKKFLYNSVFFVISVVNR